MRNADARCAEGRVREPGNARRPGRRRAWPTAAAPTAIRPSGTPASLPRITRDDLVAAARRAFRPDNAVLILAGDIGARRRAARSRGGTSAAGPRRRSRRPRRRPPRRRPRRRPGRGGRRHGERPARRASSSPCRCPRAAAAERADRRRCSNAVLGGGYSSRLNQEVRIKRGLSYGGEQQARRAPRERRCSASRCRPRTSRPPRSCALRAGRDRPADAGAGPRRRARRAQAHPDRRLQPQRRDDRRAGRGDPHAWSSTEPVAGRAEDADRGQSRRSAPADIQRYAAAHLGAAEPAPRRRRRGRALRRGAQGRARRGWSPSDRTRSISSAPTGSAGD